MLRHLLPLSALALILLLLAGPTAAADLFVDADGQGAYATIADAVAAATNGDTIWLSAGTYSGPGNRDVTVYRDITIRANNFPDPTVIDCEGTAEEPHRAFVVEYCDATFFGLTVTNGFHTSGGAMTIEEGNVNLEHCEFRGNTATRGGALYTFEAAQVTCEQSIFAGNRADDGGGAVSADVESQVTLSRCTLVANGAPSGGHVYLENDAATIIDRSLLVFAHQGAAVSDYYCPNATVTCSDVHGNRGGDWTDTLQGQGGQDGNIDADPLLADPMGDLPDYRLTFGTPAWVGSADCGHMGAVYFDGTTTTPIYGLEPDGTGMFATLQDAMDAIPAGAVIEMTHGSYSGEGNVGLDPLGKAMTVRTRSNPDELHARLWMGGGFSGNTLLTLQSGEGATTRFSDLYFHGAMAGRILHVVGAVGARFEECIFVNGYADGAVALIEGEPGSPAAVMFEDCGFGVNYSNGTGCAGILATYWQVGLVGCDFHDNYAPGGASSLDLDACTGQVTNCTFQANEGFAAVQVSDEPGTSLRLLGCDFLDNVAGTSADLMAELVGELVLDNCTFTGSQGGDRGGSISASGAGAGATLTLADCQFTAPAEATPCAEGGAIAVDGLALDMSGCTVTGWKANGNGGGLQANGCTVDLLECRFEQNQAAVDGGAIHLHDCAAVIAETALLENQATQYGGGLFLDSGTARLEYGSIAGNLARMGGAVFAGSEVEQILVQADNMLIHGNTAEHHGGALYMVGADVRAELQQCTIHANETQAGYEEGSQIVSTSFARIDAQHCLITGSETSAASGGPGDIFAYCCNVWGNALGDWTGPLEGQLGDDENVSVNPWYCDAPAGDYRVASTSVCLPDNNACATRIGARGEGCSGLVGVDDVPTVAEATLAPACPNPFNPGTVLAFDLPRAAAVDLAVYDLRGQRLRTFHRGEVCEAGHHTVTWRGDDDGGRGLAAGVYLVRLQAGGVTSVGRVALVR